MDSQTEISRDLPFVPQTDSEWQQLDDLGRISAQLDLQSPQTPQSSASDSSSSENTPVTPCDQYIGRGSGSFTKDCANTPHRTLQPQRIIEGPLPGLTKEQILHFQPSDPFNALKLGEQIGTGLWSKVYRASDESRYTLNDTPTTFAAKLARSKFSARVIRHEAQILTYISSKSRYSQHVMIFYGYDIQHQALVLEVLWQPWQANLHEIVVGGMYKPKVFARDLIHGLHFLHSEGVIHGDIKPENIFIRRCETNDSITKSGTAHGRNLKAIYGDFSASRFDSPDSILGEAAGTYDYMAPELFATVPAPYPTKASDVYALGVALMTVTVGESPYNFAINPIARRAMAMQGIPLQFMERHSDLQRKLKTTGMRPIVESAVANNPSDRCNTAVWKDTIDREMVDGKD